MNNNIDVRLIPEGGHNPYAAHPGFCAQDCPASSTVSPVTGVSVHGFSCYHTGGHCHPNSMNECFKPIDRTVELPYPVMKLVNGQYVLDQEFYKHH